MVEHAPIAGVQYRVAQLQWTRLRRFYQKRPKEPEAKEVRVRANVMDIIEIDQLKETFTATFKLQFEYVDPTLITTWQIIKYRKFDGKKTSVATVEGHILGYEPGHFEAQKVVLGKRLVKTVQKEKVIDADDDMEVKYAGYVCVPKKDLLSVSLPEDHNWQNHPALEWTFMNLVVREHQFIFESRHINFFDELGGHVTHEWKIQATFSERLHLKEMPFDRQLLRIQVVGEIPNYMMKFTPLFAKAGNLKNIEARENCNLPVQWTVDAPPPQLQVIKEQGEFNRARFDLHIYVERNPRFYTQCLFACLAFYTREWCSFRKQKWHTRLSLQKTELPSYSSPDDRGMQDSFCCMAASEALFDKT